MKKLSDAAIYYYNSGYNCCDCILKAAESLYGLQIPQEEYRAFSGFANGYGVGGMCSALNGAIAVMGMLFGESEVSNMRLKLLSEFKRKYGGYNCSGVFSAAGGNCESVIRDAADILERTLMEP